MRLNDSWVRWEGSTVRCGGGTARWKKALNRTLSTSRSRDLQLFGNTIQSLRWNVGRDSSAMKNCGKGKVAKLFAR